MTSSFVPVDLDQVLDEFEEKEGSLPSGQDSYLGQPTQNTRTAVDRQENKNGIFYTESHSLINEHFADDNKEFERQHSYPGDSDIGDQFEEMNDAASDRQHVHPVDISSRQNRSDAALHSHLEGDSSSDSCSIADVIAAAEAITDVHNEQPKETGNQYTDNTFSSVENSDQSQEMNSSEIEPSYFAKVTDQKDHMDGERYLESNGSTMNANQAAGNVPFVSSNNSPMSIDSGIWSSSATADIECVTSSSQDDSRSNNTCIDAVEFKTSLNHILDTQSDTRSQGEQQSPKTSTDITHPGFESNELHDSRTNTDITHPGIESNEIQGPKTSTDITHPGFESNELHDSRTNTDITHPGIESNELHGSRTNTDITHPGFKSNELHDSRTNTDVTHPSIESNELHGSRTNTDLGCPESESNGAHFSTVDTLDTSCGSCTFQAGENNQLDILHGGEETQPVSDILSTSELYSAGSWSADNELNLGHLDQEKANSTEQTVPSADQLTASPVHDHSNMEPSNDEDCATTECSSTDVINVSVEAIPEDESQKTQVRHVGFTLQPLAVTQDGNPGARRISSGESGLGTVPPLWVPDSVASHCMNCGLKFGVIKRKHHCRACGKVLCSSCCNMKFSLVYLDNKDGRVCQVCCNALLRAQAISQVTEQLHNLSPLTEFEENVEQEVEPPEVPPSPPLESLESIDVAQANDGIATEELSSSPSTAPQSALMPQPDESLPAPTSPALSEDSDCLFRLDVDHVRSLMPQEKTVLPPVMNVAGGGSQLNEKAILVTENPDPAEVMYKLKGLGETVVFLVNKNLVVKVKIIKLNCCVKKKCWCFVTQGMGGATQEEMVILLECLPKESTIPTDIFSHFNTAFAYAKEGHTVSNLGYTIFGQPFLGSMDNAGFLYIKPTFQCLENIPLPSTPYVFAVLIQRPETPWAQLFPLRLMLRLGAEFRYYPCPLWSVRNRTPVYGQIGHTILNLLADFKNFQYTLPPVTGLLIHLEEQQTKLLLPQDRYDEVVKVLNSTDDHVMALGATFSEQADSHLVCMQDDAGYKTQAINIQNLPRKVTGASFLVFTGALKTSSPYSAKVNIVEDGILVQLTSEAILELRQALREMRDHVIKIGIPGRPTEEMVILEWVTRMDNTQRDICSEIDGLALDGFPSMKMHAGADFTRRTNLRIQWSDVFFMNSGAKTTQFAANKEVNKMLVDLSKACCKALKPHLVMLSQQNLIKIGLRVNMDADSVGYIIGSSQQPLPADLMADLDNEMVPAINSAATRYRRGPLVMELLFRILKLF